MEPLDTLTPDPHQRQKPRILEQDYVQGILTTTYKWAKFLGIIGFIACGFMILAGLGIAAIGSSFPSNDNPVMNLIGGSALGVIYILVAALYFFPSRYLYQYAEKLNLAVQSEDEAQLILALDKNKSFFKFIGITTVAILALYVLMFIGIIAGVAMGSEFINS